MNRRRRFSTRGGEVGAALTAVLVARLAVNGGIRVVYPFLPQIADGLGVSLATLTVLLALRWIGPGVLAPVCARLTERWGSRRLMLAATVLVAAGCLLTVAPGWWAFAAVGFVAVGLGKPLFDVPMQSWFSRRVPYAERARVIGITELTWGLSLLVTVPLSGYLIAGWSWRAPFLLVAGLALLGTLTVGRLIAADAAPARRRQPLVLTGARRAVLGTVALFTMASELLFVRYASWLGDDLGLQVVGVGLFTLVFVAAELCGEGAVVALGDRLGPRRMATGALLASAAVYLVFGLVGSAFFAAVLVVFCWLFCFEITIVATIPLVTGLAPEARERLLALLLTATAVGRATGDVLAGPLYELGGIGANGVAAAVTVLLAAGLLQFVPAPVLEPTA
ncbi:MAG: MFS transporter [Egibacteraceae bacterium]